MPELQHLVYECRFRAPEIFNAFMFGYGCVADRCFNRGKRVSGLGKSWREQFMHEFSIREMEHYVYIYSTSM